MGRTPSDYKRQAPEDGDTGTSESPPSRGIARGPALPLPAAPESRSRSGSSAPPAPAEARGRTASPRSATGSLPFRDVKGARSEALPVQHSLCIGLLLPKPLSRPRRRETFEEAHCGTHLGDTDQEAGGTRQTLFAVPLRKR